MLCATGCSSAFRSMREQNVRIELNSNDYELSEPVSGKAVVTRVLGIDWERLFDSRAGWFSIPVFGNASFSGSDAYAIYDMIEKNPGYDFVMYPQVVKYSKGFPFIYEKTFIKVDARLGKLKKEE